MKTTYAADFLCELGLDTEAPCVPLKIITDRFQTERMEQTCFRGKDLALAGNFALWNDFWEMLQDEIVEDELLCEALEIIEDLQRSGETCKRGYRFTFEHDMDIGWSSAVPIGDMKGNPRTEPFSPNRWTRAVRVTDEHTLAPSTKMITMAFDIKVDDRADGWVVFVKTIYPGESVQLGYEETPKDIDPSEVVFFDWDHPGEPIT
jgi:hypothetical protein